MVRWGGLAGPLVHLSSFSSGFLIISSSPPRAGSPSLAILFSILNFISFDFLLSSPSTAPQSTRIQSFLYPSLAQIKRADIILRLTLLCRVAVGGLYTL